MEKIIENLVLINLGSNSVRMSINQVHAGGTYQEVEHCKNDFRLLKQLESGSVFDPQTFQKTEQILNSFKAIYSKYPLTRVFGIATAAVRQAHNGHAFARQLSKDTGIPIRILTENQEADCDYLGTKDQIGATRYLVMDTGGGSIELIYVDGSQRYLASIPRGAISLAIGFGLTDVPNPGDWDDAVKFFQRQLKQIPWFSKVASRIPLVLVGGSNRAVARISRHLRNLPHPDHFEKYVISRDEIRKISKYLSEMNLDRRETVSGLEPKRASVILGGLIPLTCLIASQVSKVIFSNRGVRQGLINKLINLDS